jgi:multicomponent Na+:H+ antiporter subunit E
MKSRILSFFLSFVVWLALTGSFEIWHVIAGALVALLVAFVTGKIFTKAPTKFLSVKRYLIFFFEYVPVFIYEVIKANIDVAYRVLHPDIPIKPGIVKIKTTLHSDAAITMLANSITLKPGSLTLDVDTSNGILYVHMLQLTHQDSEQATASLIGRLEPLLRRIFE